MDLQYYVIYFGKSFNRTLFEFIFSPKNTFLAIGFNATQPPLEGENQLLLFIFGGFDHRNLYTISIWYFEKDIVATR